MYDSLQAIDFTNYNLTYNFIKLSDKMNIIPLNTSTSVMNAMIY